MWAKQSTAATVIIGPVLDSTGAEYASAVIGDLSISKNGGTLTALASAATLTLIANGQYTLVLTTGNVDTLGRAQITCNKSTYQMPSIELMVLPSTVFDALITNAVNATGGLVGATAAITTMAGVISTLTQTQVTGGAYAINNASFAFDTGLDFTTTQKAATLARVTLNDTTTTNTDMRGTDNAALAATALSTTQWTNTLATNIGTTNTTVASNLDATISGRMATYAQPTGFLAATFPATVASTTNITAATGITVSSIGANVVNASALAADAVTEIADGIWDEATSGHTTAGTYGGRIVRATNSNVEVQITGSNHVAADVHAFQTDVIDSSAIAASAVTEIQSGLATAANLLIVSDGVGFITSVLMGTISDAGTAGETYVITFGGATYTSDFAGLDSTGNRTGVTRTKV